MAKLIGVLGQEVGKAAQQSRALSAGHAPPGSFIKGRASSADGSVNVRLIRFRHNGPGFAGIRVDAFKGPA